MRTTLSVLAIIALSGAVGGCSQADSEPDFQTVRGHITGVSVAVYDNKALVGFEVEADIHGDLEGTATAEFTITGFDDDGTIRLSGGHVFKDSNGRFLFRTTDTGFTAASGEIQNSMTIVEGAEGHLETLGTVDMQTGELTLEYAGSIRR